MSLSREQGRFTFMVGQLIDFAYKNGYYMTFGKENAKHKKDSFHDKALAKDFNLFDAKTGVYLTRTKDHEPLGVFWESMGGTWGGRFENKDGNHYSLGE